MGKGGTGLVDGGWYVPLVVYGLCGWRDGKVPFVEEGGMEVVDIGGGEEVPCGG